MNLLMLRPPLLRRAVSICVLIVLSLGGWARAEELSPDAALAAAVRNSLPDQRHSAAPLTAEHVQELARLVANGAGITNLKGLEACPNLRELQLANNNIADLVPLRKLRNLQMLDVAQNQLEDISPVGELHELQYFQADHNQIVDLAPLANLENLNALYLEYNRIQDLRPLADRKKLWSLYLDYNRIQDLGPLKKLRGVESLGLSFNKIEDIAPLAELAPKQFLFLQGNKITDLTPLVQLAERDASAEQELAPFWRVYLGGNPLSKNAETAQIGRLKELGAKEINLDPPSKEELEAAAKRD